MGKVKRTPPGSCAHCGQATLYAWVHTTEPTHNPIYLCVACMNAAQVGSYASPAYERVAQPTYRPLLKPHDSP